MPAIPSGNLFADVPARLAAERFDELVAAGGVRVERILSRGHASPPGFWYEQERTEWVMVVAGQGRLEVAGEPEPLELGPGDWVVLPAGLRHRVAWTVAGRTTVWLAVYYPP